MKVLALLSLIALSSCGGGVMPSSPQGVALRPSTSGGIKHCGHHGAYRWIGSEAELRAIGEAH